MKRKQFALNKLFNLLIVVGLFLAWFSVELFMDDDIAWGVGLGIAALLIMVGSALFAPFCYAFDREGVSLCYVFLPTERYLWKNIYAIEVEDISTGTRATMFDFFYASVFSISGRNEGKQRFYMEGHIRKSFRTKYLLEKYWDGTITGYLFEGVKKRINKRRTKKQSQTKTHLTDEIVPMERELRAESKKWLTPFLAQAKQYDLEIKT